jgi:predicted lipid-binding transport protein (Tim44 family)
MGDGFQFLDIILLAMVAAFIFLRLRGVLGKRMGHEQSPQEREEDNDHEQIQDDDNVIQLGDHSENEALSDFGLDPIDKTLGDIKRIDRSFDKATFLQGAESAYEYIVMAFANGDRDSLKNLLADDVYDNFERSISDREAAGQKMFTDIVAIRSAELIEADLTGKTAELTIKFQTEMISRTEDEEGEDISGDSGPRTVTEIWTFSKNLKSRDPNWRLITTRSES